MKIIKLLFLTLIFLLVIFVKNVNAVAICTDTTGGCNGPEDNADFIGNGSTLAFCQSSQADSNWIPICTSSQTSYIDYASMGPRGDKCTQRNEFCPRNRETCTCENGSTCTGMAKSPLWDYKECAKCNNSAFSATWNQTAGSATVNASADNWRPILYHVCILHCGGGSGDPLWDTHVRFPDSYLDFMFRVYESGNPTPIKEVQVVPNANPPTNMNCVYHTYDTVRGGGQSRSNLQNYVTCSISNYQITGLTFNPGKTYSIKTLIKAHYADDTQWMDYVPDGTPTGKNYQICNSELTIPVLPSPTPTPTGALSCDSLVLASKAIPQLGGTLDFTCFKNASYTAATTYDFRLIYKQSGSDPDPNPLPTPFVEKATSENTSYQLPSGQYGFYLFQCRVCSGAFCTDWQYGKPPLPTATPTTTCIQPGRGCSVGSTPCCQIGNAYECLAGTCTLVGGPQP